MSLERKSFVVRGVVQGVGFRPFVHGLAVRHGLAGWVRNDGGEVSIEVEGGASQIVRFARALRHPPQAGRVDGVEQASCATTGEAGFRIGNSESTRRTLCIAADTALCPDCAREVQSSRDRRYGHPFITCSQCGPRLTIVRSVPYDRERTSMSPFVLCDQCQLEYESPTDRRFHAQPIACHRCGPRLSWLGESRAATVADLVSMLEQGAIVAVKGVGGYHLLCDATRAEVVERLRRGKVRPAQPFAVMAADMSMAEQLAHLGGAERRALQAPDRPVVVCAGRMDSGLTSAVAPGVRTVGLMLPYTALHLLAARGFGRPIVVTSANVSGGAIVTNETRAAAELGGVVDAIVAHDREIVVPCEDSVCRIVSGRRLPLRRSRGQAPLPIHLPARVAAPTLAVGGGFKAVFGFALGDRATLGPHFGDLDNPQSLRAWSDALEHFEALLSVRPERIVHDLHPEYESTRYALERARALGVPTLGVQHHHAHMSACMAEHGLTGDVIGVCFDGVGLGTDGTAWGGEFLIGGYAAFERAAHLVPFSLPGGDRAAREPWRVALVQLLRAGVEVEPLLPVSGKEVRLLRNLVDGSASLPITTSMGRLFDAAGAIILGQAVASYEAEVAVRLENCAEAAPASGHYAFDLLEGNPLMVCPATAFLELARDRVNGETPTTMARRFHAGVAAMVVRVCQRLRDASGLDRVVLSGGVFCNALLEREVRSGLRGSGVRVFSHEQVPPNDGGLCLGQLAVATAGGGP
jgi:hydrogenase maturation protein HypF